MYHVSVPPLTDKAYLLKEYLYEEIVRRREFLIRIPRPPKKEIWKGKEHLRESFKPVADHVFSDPVVAEILSDAIVGPSEFRIFVERVTTKLSEMGVEEARNVAIHLAMSLMRYDVLGFILLDENVEEVAVNGPKDVFVYHKKQGFVRADVSFPTKADILEIIDQIAHIHGKVLDERHPFLDATLPDGSRVNATIPPATPESPTITIRKFSKHKLSILDLIRYGTLTTEAAAYLWIAVEGLRLYPLNILVIGGTASGKTTTLNALLAFVPADQRIITVEDTREIYVPHQNRVHMISYDGITMNDLLINALRMRPDRIIVGEVRGSEAITLFQAMDVGHRGTMGTLHANNAIEAKERLIHDPMNVPESMLPLVNLYVVMKRFPDGSRKVTEIVESVRGGEGIAYGPIFKLVAGQLRMVGSLGQNMEILAREANTTKAWLMQELRRRQRYLEQLLKVNLDFRGFFHAVNKYGGSLLINQ